MGQAEYTGFRLLASISKDSGNKQGNKQKYKAAVHYGKINSLTCSAEISSLPDELRF